MILRPAIIFCFASLGLAACATSSQQGTLAELAEVDADLDEVYVEDGLERAAESYRRYLQETSESALTPEAMRRLADLQLEQEYGVIGGGRVAEMAVPDVAKQTKTVTTGSHSPQRSEDGESEQDFEQRATQRETMLSASQDLDELLPVGASETVPAGPREAIETYRSILANYPNYERNDQVMYQMSRAYDEIGESDEAMAIMNRLVAEYPYSHFVDEVQFRRGEYYFVRKKYLDAEDAYGAIINMGESSSYYELALYKLGWALYKQELYEDALHQYITMLDYRASTGYNFDVVDEEGDEHRVADTFRVISLSFSNLGGPEVVDEYFSARGHRSYADKIYGNLGEFYFTKLRYDDAASVYRSFISLNPFHRISPHFGMRVVEIYGEAGFPILVVESKIEFATMYALNAEYWHHYDVEDSPEVVGFLKTNLTDLATHYHSVYQNENMVDEETGKFRRSTALV